MKHRITSAGLIFAILGLAVAGCRFGDRQITQITARPVSPTIIVEPGEHQLGLGGIRLVNRNLIQRDGLLYIPRVSEKSKPIPLLVWLHGGGGNCESYRYLFSIAEDFKIVILALDARHNTWDGIDSPFGPDVEFIDAAMKYTFDRVHVDPGRVVLGGLSDGASYTLAIGRVNGDLFTHLVAVAPGHLEPPAPVVGNPKILVAHGMRDNVYHVAGSRNFIVPGLKKAGYNVSYLEFDGPHWLPSPVAVQVFKWIME
jgi:phospholipase/carboxylesterase